MAEKSEKKPKVCIIGAGVSGLPCIKSCLEEGFIPVCFEKTSDIGGLWNYRHLGKGISTVYKSTIVNTSKEMMAFSDFPPQPNTPNFMHNTQVMDYLREYIEKFDLHQYIRFDTEIKSVRQAPDYEESGRWLVEAGEKGEEELFDAVMVASGHHMTPSFPQFPGLEKWSGDVIHSQLYKDPSPFHGKTVLVVGIGNSGLDAAVELAQVAKQVYLSTRRGAWIWNRVAKRGFPYDIWYFSRWLNFIREFVLPEHNVNSYFEHLVNSRMDHELYRLKPQHRFFSQHPSVNDALPNLVLAGRVKILGDVEGFVAGTKGVRFVDGTELEGVDLLVLCTGYNFDFPFLDSKVFPSRNNQVDLYKLVYPPQLPHPTLAMIGLIQPYGAVQPISELQARWVVQHLRGNLRLPAEPQMREEIRRRRRLMAQRYVPSPRHTVQVDYVQYADELAGEMGAKPQSLNLLLKDPRLFWAVVFGPCTPYGYRLTGPGKWSGAREAVLGTKERVLGALATRKTKACRSAAEDSRRNELLLLGKSAGLLTIALGFILAAVLSTAYGWASAGGAGLWAGMFVIAVLVFLLHFDIFYDLSTSIL